jgi:ribosomal protein S25
MDNDLMPNHTEDYFPQPQTSPDEASQEAENHEQHVIRSAGPALIEELLDWLDSEIKSTDSIQAAHLIADRYKISTSDALTALNVVNLVMSQKRQRLVALKELYMPQPE